MACIQRTHVHRDSGSLAIGATSPNPKWGSSIWEMSGRGLGSVWWGSVRDLGVSGGDLVGVWWGSERGLGIPLDTTQTPPKHPRHPPQTPLKTSPRHPPEPCETPTRHPPNAFHTPTRPPSDPTQTQAPHTPSHTPPETPSHPPPSTPRHPLRHHPDTQDPHFGFGL